MSQPAVAQQPPAPPPAEKTSESETRQSGAAQSEPSKRTDLNLLGKTDAASGESRRNENVQFNLVDNNALKELNVRLGTTATIVREFSPASSYFGAEFGNAPKSVLAVPAALRQGMHGNLTFTHLNSVLSARSFFQVGGVRPAHENDYGFNFGAAPWKSANLFIDGSQQKVRGSVNGNVLVPKPDERTPLATDPVTRAIVARFLAAFPAELPNRTDINPRALNTNSPQVINGNQAGIRLDQSLNGRDGLTLQYQFTSQNVDAFQFIAGQNPNTDTKSHLARIVWTRQWNPTTVIRLSAGYDRLASLLEPEKNAVGPFIQVSGLSSLGPDGSIPIDRAQNQIRSAGQMSRVSGSHTLAAGFGVVRRQLNGRETDVHRGFFSFGSDFGRDAITNFRLGFPSQHIVSIGNVHRGFRSWDLQFYAGDNWKVNQRLNLQYGLRYQPSTAPVEVNGLNTIPYDCDCNNIAPTFGFAYRLPRQWGVTRAAYGTHFGEIFPVTFQQIRFSPPGNYKIVVTAPNLVDPLGSASPGGQLPLARPTLYHLDPELAVPYSHQYNLSWEPEWSKTIRLQLGYVGSRSHKLFVMWYLNRAHPVEGIPQTTATVNQRRPNQDYADIRVVLNGSRGYFDAARASLILSNWRGLTMDASYWFSKAMDLGTSYTNTANENDSRTGRSQSEFETHRDMKGLSPFDQTHAFLWRVSYITSLPSQLRWLAKAGGGWSLSAVTLVKTGIPFNVVSGADGPGFGNVDGNGSDRPNLLDPSILGRTISNPNTSKQLLPRAAFAFIRPTDERGNLGRNVFRKGPIHNVNASLARVWAVRREVRLTFRAESINLFNAPQFAEPGFELVNQNFGQITNTLNDGRTFRFTMQLGW
ncbi:MAG TPA: TonB-dependent receptor [Blastocatellia bacterium]|nr:TonB-dependent receptor [Blastocatellia bacterium]